MQPLVKGALAVAVLAAVSALVPAPKGRPRAAARPTTSSEELLRMPCGARELPEGDACVPIPALAASADGADSDPPDEPDRATALLPRRPDRPASVSALALPLAGDPPLLDVPSAAADDRSVLRLGAPRGTPAHAVALDGQDGPFEVLGVERLPGRGLVVGALAKLAGVRDDEASYLVLFGSLDGAGPSLARGTRVVDGAVVGFAGETASPGEPCVRFEARRLRPGTDAHVTPLARLVTDAESIATDARNVLPPRPK